MVNMALGGTGHTHTQTRFSNLGQECDAFTKAPNPNAECNRPEFLG